jgi:hypothetical protein
MVVSASDDAGETFAAPVRVAEDNWKINGCPESGATALVAGHRLYVAWMTETTPQQAGVKLTWSDDGAKSFAPPVLVSKGLLDANHPVLSASGDSDTVLVFQARDAGGSQNWSPESPYLVEIDATGKVSQPAKIPAGASVSYPTVVSGGAGRVFFAWNQSGNGGTNIFFSRGRKSFRGLWRRSRCVSLIRIQHRGKRSGGCAALAIGCRSHFAETLFLARGYYERTRGNAGRGFPSDERADEGARKKT